MMHFDVNVTVLKRFAKRVIKVDQGIHGLNCLWFEILDSTSRRWDIKCAVGHSGTGLCALKDMWERFW